MNELIEFTELSLVAGVDEVGRGPLVGPVVTAAVMLDPLRPIKGLRDSKKLTEKTRLRLAEEIKEKAYCWSLGRAEADEIDQLNILQATLLAMQRAVLALLIPPHLVLVDGNRCPQLPMPVQAIVKGDSKIAAISAASIIAKVARDEEMKVLDHCYPAYGFAQHKGYPTALHLLKLTMLGPITQHRRSFSPVQKALALQQKD